MILSAEQNTFHISCPIKKLHRLKIHDTVFMSSLAGAE